MEKINVAFGSHWKTIHPGEQHTLVGDLVLSNQFEALVGINSKGRAIPLGAKSWTINDDFTEYIFTIDTSRRFSDGSTLKASDYKRSWEDSLKLEPKSAKSSLLDVLYKIEGFEDFEKLGELSGVIAGDDQTLIVRFKTPFRMALDHLMGNRYSVYKETEKGFVGTGKYLIKELENGNLSFIPSNTSADRLDEMEIFHLHSKLAVDSLLTDKIQVFAYGRGADVPTDIDKKIGVIVGQDALHETVFLNRRPGHIFEKKEFRQALQYLILDHMKSRKKVLGNPNYWSLDEQIFLPFQPGRLSQGEVDSIVANGKKYVEPLMAAVKAHPLVIFTSKHSRWLKQVLSELDIPISDKSRDLETKEVFQEIYKGLNGDIMSFIFSVAHGDPDGIYHMLGPKGAIQSPMVYSDSVGQLLEEGRKIVNHQNLDEFYKKVAAEALKDVPFVHLGFSKAVALYRKDKIEVLDKELRRNEGHLHIYRWR